MINGKQFTLGLVIILLGIMLSLQTVFAQDAQAPITIEVCIESLECFDALATTFGATQDGTMHTGGGGGAGKVDIEDITVIKNVDINTPHIFIAVASGTQSSEAVIEYKSIAGGEEVTFMTITLSSVLITQLQIVSETSKPPTESISLNFAKICMGVAEISPGGKPGPMVERCFNIESNQEE